MNPALFDLEVLRSMVLVHDAGGLRQAAKRVGRTPSAVSIQMRKLEEQVAMPLFVKAGRRLTLNAAGQLLLGYARRLLAVEEEARHALGGAALQGGLRLGLLQDFAETILPDSLAAFIKAHPQVETEVIVDRSVNLMTMLREGDLDLALTFDPNRHPGSTLPATRVARAPMVWVARADYRPGPTLDLMFLQGPCVFRDAALKNLGEKQPWRQTLSTPSLSGIWAAVGAGLGLSVRTELGLPAGLTGARRLAGRPPLPMVEVTLTEADRLSPVALRLKAALLDTLRSRFAGSRVLA
ncbi:MAG TPA: LysR substrate-binding domain-containing protein [Chthoniobacterales bacterium]